MSINVEQFHQVFFEESFEGLDIMESGLLNLDLGAADVEENQYYFSRRALHEGRRRIVWFYRHIGIYPCGGDPVG